MPGKSLREQLREGRFVVAPGVYDGISALVADRGDFGALYLSGYAVSASLLGRPDAGYLTLTHLADRVRMVCSVSDKPLIADADTGFGGLVHVEEAVRCYERAGAQAIQLEDQEFPKRCGHTKDRRVIDRDEAALKIRVAVESRDSGDFLIVARTDARTSLGLDECFRRTDTFLEAGADILFIESPESLEEMRAIAERYPDIWLLANLVDGGRTPLATADALEELGFNLAIYPLFGLSATVPGLEEAYGQLENTGQVPPGAYPFDELNRLVGFEHIWDLDSRER
ncbi:MAG: isocitrate lyase/PEP mutase family protein [Gammaproteobacteria bacterium AqS3]|nr:isocitrate lyase/PEP mutase family protein [Gammaproteobacteria bacterium AqS3]